MIRIGLGFLAALATLLFLLFHHHVPPKDYTPKSDRSDSKVEVYLYDKDPRQMVVHDERIGQLFHIPLRDGLVDQANDTFEGQRVVQVKDVSPKNITTDDPDGSKTTSDWLDKAKEVWVESAVSHKEIPVRIYLRQKDGLYYWE